MLAVEVGHEVFGTFGEVENSFKIDYLGACRADIVESL